MMSSNTVFALLAAFGAAMFAAGAARRRAGGLDAFLVADRSVGAWVGAMSVASTWIWAPALFLAAQKAYQQGLPGLAWFTVPNVGCLVFFAFLTVRIRKVFPKGYTLPEYIAARFDAKTHVVYVFSFLSLQICAMAVQLIAGGALLRAMSGLPYAAGVLLLAFIFTSYSLVDGLRASIRTDFFQMLLIGAGIVLLAPMAVSRGGGWDAVVTGLAGYDGRHGNLFDPWVAYSFGVTVTIGLMSGPVGDQQHWQRAFAFAEGKGFRGYLLGAAIFSLVPLSLGLLGFIAAGNPGAAPGVREGALSAQQVGPEVIRTLLPPWGMLVFMIMILCGLASTGDSALCAGGSLAAIDIYRRYIRPDAADAQILRTARWTILMLAMIAIAIALIPGVTILKLFLFYGTLRSATFVPTLFILFCRRLSATPVFWGAFLAMILGLPAYLAGELTGNVDLKVAANIGILIVSFLPPFLSTVIGRER